MKTSASILLPTGRELAFAVAEEEYKRLLELPRSARMNGAILHSAENAREWYATNGEPFVATTKLKITKIETPVIQLENNIELSSIDLAQRLQSGDAHSIVILAASAGIAVANKVSAHWSAGRPDEAFFLDRFAVAVTEHLIQWTSTLLCRSAESQQETLLPHLSPGCAGWDLSDQQQLMAALTNGYQIGPLKLHSTGALDPQYSVMAALGVTRRKFSTTTLKDICRACDLHPCSFRRAPYQATAFGTMS